MVPDHDRFKRSINSGYVGSRSNWSSAPRRVPDYRPKDEPTGLQLFAWTAVTLLAAWLAIVFVFSF